MRADLAGAFMLLTRLPAGWIARGAPPSAFADAVWAYPVVGAVVGGVGGAVYWACCRLGLAPAVAAVWTLAAVVLTTGALHEDGLADTADGFGGGATRAEKLEIMRDSRIGGYGALAVLLALAARGTAIAVLARPAHVATALIAAGALGRGAMLVLLLWLLPARADGLAAGLRARGTGRAIAGLAVAAAIALVALPASAALGGCAAALVASLALAWIAHRQIGGYTGDVLGAASVIAECAVLGVLSASLKP